MKRFAVLAVIIFSFSVLLFSIFQQRSHSVEARIRKLSKQFNSCLPSSITREQKKEINGILDNFNRALSRGRVIRKDRDDVFKTLSHYVERGDISREELSIFMAKISYYTFRQNADNRTENGRIKPPEHPLLKPYKESMADSN